MDSLYLERTGDQRICLGQGKDCKKLKLMSFGNCSIKKLFKFQDNAVHFISFITVHGRPEVLCKNGIVKNFAGKHLCQGLFFNKVAGLRPATLLK